MEEGRKQDRVGCDIILNKVEAGHTNICRATNISLGGMQFVRLIEPQKCASDAKIRLQFELPGQEEPIWVGAERVYDDGKCVGVRFVNISHHHFVLLREWLRERSIQYVAEFAMN